MCKTARPSVCLAKPTTLIERKLPYTEVKVRRQQKMKRFELTVKRVAKLRDFIIRWRRYCYSLQTSRAEAEGYKVEYSARLSSSNPYNPQKQRPSKYHRPKLVWCSNTSYPFSAYLRTKGAKLLKKERHAL
jgi:hypothetical protein